MNRYKGIILKMLNIIERIEKQEELCFSLFGNGMIKKNKDRNYFKRFVI